MSDFEMLENVSGAAGGLAQGAQLCHGVNDMLTKAFDEFLGGHDNTDTFDASCNTCSHFLRERFDRKVHPPSIYGFPGRCSRFDKPTLGWPRGQYCGFENDRCYENRRTGLTPAKLVEVRNRPITGEYDGENDQDLQQMG